jgi:two-component system, LytTR family, sensor kinase
MIREPAASAPPGRAPRPGVWAATLGFWTVLGLLESGSAYVRLYGTARQRTWPQMLVANMPWWLLWAGFTPLVFALARRVPVHGPRWWRGVAAHLAAAFAFASAHLLLEGAVYYYTVSYRVLPNIAAQYRVFFGNYVVLDFVTYWAIVGGCYAFDFYARYRESALRSARLEAQKARLELGLAEARMQALRAELNPHFFFNALNAVSGLVRRRENDAAVRMLARLGELLRTTLDRDTAPEIPLRDELALLDRYLDVERVRFGDRLTVAVEHDGASAGALVPTLILQPLVENAIRHGVSARPGNALVQVLARREGARLRIAVRDTGEGVGPAARRDGLGLGIGLSNTRARLAELYGAEASVALDNAPGGGACVTLTFPYRAAVEQGHVALGA